MFLGIDLGGTNTKYAVLGESGEILFQGSVLTLDKNGSLNPSEKVEEIVEKAYEYFPDCVSQIQGIGIAFAGFVDFQKGVIIKAPNLPVENYPLASIVEASVNIPVFVENDVNAYLAGEMVSGAGKDGDNVVCLALGTGVGGAVSINGSLLRGSASFGAEMGHMMIQIDSSRRCGCGLNGCLEAFASATALLKEFRKLASYGHIETLLVNAENVTVKDIFDYYHENDPLCLRVVDDYLKYLAIGMANYIHIFNPDTFIIGGGVANGLKIKDERLFYKLIQEVKRNTISCSFETCTFKIAELGDYSAVVGAVHIVQEGLKKR